MRHWLAHFFKLNYVGLERRIYGGHEWLILACAGCDEEEPFVHSWVCDCHRAAPPKESESV